MKIILANPRGFCAGVNMAIDSLERALDLFGAPLYVYHEIVHNKFVVERFQHRGVAFVESLEEELSARTVGFRIEDEDLEDLKTVRDAVEYVHGRVG